MANSFIEIKGGFGKLGVKRDSITKNYDFWTKKELNILRDMMVQKVKLFEFDGEIEEKLLVYQSGKTENKVSWSLTSFAEHSKYNEYGVRDHWVTVTGNDTLERWCEKRFGIVPHVIRIGGPESHIKLGSSDNKFFFNSVDEYVQNNFGRVFATELNNAIKK